MVKILNFAMAMHHKMTCSVLLRLKLPVQFSSEVPNFQDFFSGSIPIEIDLRKLKMERKYAK